MRTARKYWAARLRAEGALPCFRCGRPVTLQHKWTVEHVLERTHGGSTTDLANQWVSHGSCNFASGGRLGAAKTNARRPVIVRRLASERSRGIRGW